MLLKRFYDTKLAQASYLIGCQATGEAVVIDPNRDITQYLKAAATEGVRITHVTETHIHADFVSGARELAARTSAQLLLSDEGDAQWKYDFARESNAIMLHDNDTFMVGNLKFQVLHTPGHTPEHLSFLVTDTPATDRPMGVFTGDFVFVGDVGRPDLLERAAGYQGTMEAGARILFQSLQRFKQLPDYLQIWPGHGAGSACGKALGAVPSTTLGYEKMVNWGLQIEDEQEFVAQVLTGQPEPPPYFAMMKRINKEGPEPRASVVPPKQMAVDQLRDVITNAGVVVDLRPAHDFMDGHIPGVLSIPVNRSFTTWAGSLLPYDRDLYLLGDAETAIPDALHDLAMIGLDRVVGYFTLETLEAWATDDQLQTLARIDIVNANKLVATDEATVLDVRGRSEWDAGHILGAHNIPLPELRTRLEEVRAYDATKPLIVQCQTGARAEIAGSLLQKEGFANIVHLTGGFVEWAKNAETKSIVEAGAS